METQHPRFVRRLSPAARCSPRLYLCLAVLLVIRPSLAVPQMPDPAAEAPRQQEVNGVVSEADGRRVLGALVALEDTAGQRLGSTLTDQSGRFRLLVPQAGDYRLRVERLGYRALVTDPFRVNEGETVRRDVEVTGEPIPVAGVEVVVEAAQRGCVLDPEQGALVADLWEQAQQAFRRVTLTDEESGGYRFHLRRYERTVELPTARVVQERWREPSSSLRSFESPPAETLLEEGWVQSDADGNVIYYAPDLQVLLSEAFQQAHCLGVSHNEAREEEVGIAFEPVLGVRVPGIRGMLWMERESLELRRLEFSYTEHGFDQPIPPPLLELFGGEMGFRALPDGRWVVDRWVLRVPRFQPAGRALEWRSAETEEVRERLERIRRVVERAPRTWQQMVREGRLLFWEEGGTLAQVETPRGAILPARTEAALEGVVWDSLQAPGSAEIRTPLEGAEVRLLGTGARTETDDRGRFRLEVPMEGSYQATFHHPTMDRLRIGRPDPVTVHLRPGFVEEVDFAIPSRATFLARRCAEEDEREGTGVLVGTVLDEALRTPVGGALVTLRPESSPEDPEQEVLPTVQARADGDGSYWVCGVPAGTTYEITATVAEVEGPTRRVVVPTAGRTVELNALVDRGHRRDVAGRVAEGAGGPAVAGARITLEGPELYETQSDASGRFRVPEIAPGAYSVRVEHLAYRNVETELEIPTGTGELTADITLLRDAIALEPIVASVEARSPRLERAGFYDRQRSGFGSFIAREDIDRRNPAATTHLFNALPRAQAVGGRILFRGSEVFGGLILEDGEMSSCFPELYVDGVWWGSDYSLDSLTPDEVEAIEVYGSPARIPIQYNTADSACGVILIWLRDGSDVGSDR